MSVSWVEVLKIFLEKHLIPTVISLFAAGLEMLFSPNDFWMIKKITEMGVYLLIAAGCFLAIQLLRYFYDSISKKNI